MNFDPATWGTVGQWASALITGLAFSATFYVILRDAKVRRIAQARKVVYVSEATEYVSITTAGFHNYEDGPAPVIHRYILKNLSDEPIYNVRFIADGARNRGRRLAGKDVVLPGDEFACEDELDSPPVVAFRDNSDVGWLRNIKGKIHPIGGTWLTQKDASYAERSPKPLRRISK